MKSLGSVLLNFAKGTSKAGKFVITERVITIATRGFTDVPMLYLILSDPKNGWLKCMIFVTPLYVIVCAVIVYISDFFHVNGIDITGIEEMRSITHEDLRRKQIFKRFIRWFMKRDALIFWIGSCVYLDPDYVTLMLRKKEDSFSKTILVLTTPSVLVSMLYWTTIYWLVYQPFRHTTWAQWISERL